MDLEAPFLFQSADSGYKNRDRTAVLSDRALAKNRTEVENDRRTHTAAKAAIARRDERGFPTGRAAATKNGKGGNGS